MGLSGYLLLLPSVVEPPLDQAVREPCYRAAVSALAERVAAPHARLRSLDHPVVSVAHAGLHSVSRADATAQTVGQNSLVVDTH